MYITDTATQSKRPFEPITPNKVSLYVCGVTVYDYCHIGHARVYCFFDTVYKYFREKGYDVHYVQNITDIDDKIITRAQQNNETIEAITGRFEKAMWEDFETLGIERPTQQPKATEYMPQIVSMIEQLVEKKLAYLASNKDVYYRVSAFKSYGKLSNQSLDDLKAGARVESSAAKESPVDFVLWKAAKEGEPSWDSPWGPGRPGWHIECSAMSTSCIGPTIDIHGGGRDLLFPHHENERAQSEGCTQKNFVNHWMHVGFVSIDGEKMSKSLGNFFTIREVLKAYHPEVVRMLLIGSHYRSPIHYSDQSLKDAKRVLERLYSPIRTYPDVKAQCHLVGDYYHRFDAALADDFNTPVALSVLFDLVAYINKEPKDAEQACGLLKYLANLLGLLSAHPNTLFQSDEVDAAWVEDLIEQRNAARKAKEWGRADEIRNALTEKGIILEDASGVTVWRKG